jgi:hypothetical protein
MACPRLLLLCGRQTGKSTVAAALALLAALLEAPALVLLLSPSLRQSSELFRDKFLSLYHDLGQPAGVVKESALRIELSNGSRVISLPGDESNIRGFSNVRLIVIDEAARVPDALYFSVRPMLAVSQGRLIALSTPYGKRGFFFDEWSGSKTPWVKVKVKASECPRIPAEFLDEERRAIGLRWFDQEYDCQFVDVIEAAFSHESIMRAVSNNLPPWFGMEGA